MPPAYFDPYCEKNSAFGGRDEIHTTDIISDASTLLLLGSFATVSFRQLGYRDPTTIFKSKLSIWLIY